MHKTISPPLNRLLNTVMKLYHHYLDLLERYIESIPETETKLLMELEEHLQEVQEALNHDMNLFDEAVAAEENLDIRQLKEQLKINAIYQQLRS
ncbi:MAG: hypothetical protein V1908_03685 [Candidatus Peregrinibacteria bacterium]